VKFVVIAVAIQVTALVGNAQTTQGMGLFQHGTVGEAGCIQSHSTHGRTLVQERIFTLVPFVGCDQVGRATNRVGGDRIRHVI